MQLKRKIPSNCDLSCGSWSLGVSESLFIQVKTLLKNSPEDLKTMLARDISRHHKTIPFLVFDILICQSHTIMLLKNKNIVLRVDCFFYKATAWIIMTSDELWPNILICRCCHGFAKLSAVTISLKLSSTTISTSAKISNIKYILRRHLQQLGSHQESLNNISQSARDSPWDIPFWKVVH